MLPSNRATPRRRCHRRLEGRQDVSRQPLDLSELVERAEAADEVIDSSSGERAQPVRDVVRGAHRTPLADIHCLAQLRVVLADVGVDAGLCLLAAVRDVHGHLVGHHELVTGATGFVDRLLDLRQLILEFVRVTGAAAGHPAIAVLGDAARGATDNALRLVLLLGADGQPRIADHPDWWWRLQWSEWSHLSSGVERDAIEGEVFALEAGLTRRPQLAQNGEPLFEDPGPLLEIETDRRVLATHPLLGVAHSRTQDGAAVRELVERSPFHRQVERMAGAGDHAGGAELDATGALRNGGEEGDRFPARFGEEAVTYPDGIETCRLGAFGQREQIGQGVVGGDQWLTIVEVDAESQRLAGHQLNDPLFVCGGWLSSSARWGTWMCSRSRRAASSASPERTAPRMAWCSSIDRSSPPRRPSEEER